MTQPTDWIYIDTPAALNHFCTELRQQLDSQPWIAIDTEFMREKTYYPQLCLLQIGTAQSIACIDPLKIEHLDLILDIIYDTSITKVFHAAHQDLEIFFHLKRSVPSPVFDTQIAAPLLGHPNQMGYAALVEATLGITLDKGHARTDWQRRPLSAAQLAYAADDVRYLGQVYLKLQQQLTDENRISWLNDDFARLTESSRYECEPGQAWKRLRASKRMRGKTLAILKSLAAWRETQARSKNLPRNWLLRDDMMCDLAKLAPQTVEELKQIRGLNDKQAKMVEIEILPLILSTLAQPVAKESTSNITRRATPQQEILIEALMAVVHIQALQNNMHPSTLATRKDVEQWLLTQMDNSELMKGWRRDMIGVPLMAMLEGRHKLQVMDGQLQVLTS